MNNILLVLSFFSFISVSPVKESKRKTEVLKIEVNQESSRVQELNAYWKNLAKTVSEGDFEGYGKGYHKDAVIIFASGKNKTSVSIAKALAGWEKGFLDTKNGKNKSHVEFRFSQRIGNATTAHETGIFVYSTSDIDGKNKKQYPTHFEMLFVKKNGKWLGVMEYQKATATMSEWNALKK
jgi:hypothetical protein